MMKIRHKKIVASGTAVALAGILGVGALLQSSISVQASPAMMPGIEQIVNDTTAEKPFKILEIVDRKDEAEIGYYVSGQEPYVKLYSYTYKYKENNEEKEETINFKTLEEGLKKLPTEELRKEFATNMKTAADGTLSGADTGIKNIQSSSYQAGNTTDSEENYPLSYSEYQEKTQPEPVIIPNRNSNITQYVRMIMTIKQSRRNTARISRISTMRTIIRQMHHIFWNFRKWIIIL